MYNWYPISNDILWASEMNQVRWYETIVRMQFIAIRSNRINQVWINSAMLSSSLSDTRMVTWTHLSSLQQRLAYSGEQSPKELRGNVTTQHPAMTKSKIFRTHIHTLCGSETPIKIHQNHWNPLFWTLRAHSAANLFLRVWKQSDTSLQSIAQY